MVSTSQARYLASWSPSFMNEYYLLTGRGFMSVPPTLNVARIFDNPWVGEIGV